MMNNKESAALLLTLSLRKISVGARPVVRAAISNEPAFFPFFLYNMLIRTGAVWFLLTSAAVMRCWLLPGCEMLSSWRVINSTVIISHHM